ncbi:hypothetical protein Cyast_2427 [Cyanobacterium stanieri PCC 7202]|uniref:Uncharacterized protein n=1 Tax=Cyanobacterium stanieri (strain ATCC 29140 / PCC 7202) TaxID=292563 RepID=K9YQH7_CYASC|nr:hypothetical protein Cyast_2427 [Cyanobacterium stanieri PCC 7202]
MNLIADKNITFEGAIALTQKFIAEIPDLEDSQQEEIVSSLVQSANGSRGFFVTYLTYDDGVVDNPSSGIIEGLKSSPTMVSELLVKNIAMSTAMKITHQRNNDFDMAESSQKVTQRTKKLVNLCQLEEVRGKIAQMKDTIVNDGGVYEDFLYRWGYDAEQKQAILEQLVS